MLDTTLTPLSGDPLFANLLSNFTGQGPFADDSYCRQMARNDEACRQVAELPRMSTHRHLLEGHDPTIDRLRNFEASSRRALLRMRRNMAETLVARERRHANLEHQRERLEAEAQSIKAFDSAHLRLFPEAFGLSRRQEPIGILPVFAIFAIGKQAELKGDNGRCRLTIRTREDGFGQRVISATSEPSILTHHWRATEQPSQFTRRGSLAGKPKAKRRHKGVLQLKQRTEQPRPWYTELDLYYDFPGIVPDRVRDKLDQWDDEFNGDVFILSEATRWRTNGARFNNAPYGDPIVFGRWINQDGLAHYWLLDRFDLSAVEFQAMEHTAQIVHGQND